MSKLGRRSPRPYLDTEERVTNETYLQIYYRIQQMACNAVQWYNMPDEVDDCLLEEYLFNRGMAAFFYDEVFEKHMVLPLSGVLEYDQNERPVRYSVTGFNGYHRDLSVDDSVVILNNAWGLPSSGMAQIFATRLTNTLRTGDVHLEAQKIGNLVAVPEIQRRGVHEIISRVKNFHLFTITTPAAAELASKVSALKTQPEYIVDRLDNHYSFLWHDCLAYFGIDSMANKQSGVNIVESRGETSAANANLNALLKARRKACDKINAMFGLSLSVDPVEDLITDIEEVEQDGELHDRTENGVGADGREDNTGQG